MVDPELQTVPRDRLAAACRTLAGRTGSRLASVVVTDERSFSDAFTIHYVFSLPKDHRYACVAADLPGKDPCFASLTPFVPGASLFEREAREFFGLVPLGHPDPRPLLLHELWPQGTHPLRRDFKAPALPAASPSAAYAFQRVGGEGVFEIPVGPVHAGIIEPGHFRFSVAGEPIINLELRLGWVHKGIEKHAEGRNLPEALRLAERVSGDASFSHGLAFCQAAERIAGAQVPPRARWLRAVFGELERLYNHLGDIAGIATDVGFPFGAAQMLLLRERVLQRNGALCGHRLLRGVLRPGGVVMDLSGPAAAELKAFLARLLADFTEVERLYLETDSLMDRVEGTGAVSKRVAEDLGAVGPAARASGVDEDLRRDQPYAAYAELGVQAQVREEGDVAARMLVKAAEFRESVSLISRALDLMPEGPCSAELGAPPSGSALGWAESPRGEVLHWLALDAQGRVSRLKVKSPSFSNWPLLNWAVQGNIVPDFPLINKSFNLSYSGNDR
ncbi:MAG: NADH-quinone oxidoreductase subunit C [Elusimicrobia bacterium]|nr:NADH-quinone oxidoreductase subunit C [Elusimicrobiota bacterium]